MGVPLPLQGVGRDGFTRDSKSAERCVHPDAQELQAERHIPARLWRALDGKRPGPQRHLLGEYVRYPAELRRSSERCLQRVPWIIRLCARDTNIARQEITSGRA